MVSQYHSETIILSLIKMTPSIKKARHYNTSRTAEKLKQNHNYNVGKKKEVDIIKLCLIMMHRRTVSVLSHVGFL